MRTVGRALVAVALMFVSNTVAGAETVQSTYDDPTLVGAQFAFDHAAWERPPQPQGSAGGIVLTLRARAPDRPAPAICQLGFFVKSNPPQFMNAGDYLRKVDTASDLRMKGAMLAAPDFGESTLESAYHPCAARPDALCARFAIESRLHEEIGVGLVFVLVHEGHWVDGNCRFYGDSRVQAASLFDRILRGVSWK
jgi:hypothetical protein